MKMEIKIVPTDMNEAQKILAALSGFDITVSSAATVAESAGAVAVSTRTESAPVEIVANEQSEEGNDPEPTTRGDDSLTLDSLTLGTERDSEQRLWCAEINSSNKATKADNTFKRKPRIEDAYYDQVVTLLDAEAAEHRASLKHGVEQGPFFWIHTDSDSCGICNTIEDRDAVANPDVEWVDEQTYSNHLAMNTEEPEQDPDTSVPAPAPTPAPTPEPQREIVAYTYQGNEYTREQLLSFPDWTQELIDAHCTPIYAEPEAAPAPAPAPVVTGDVDRESIRKRMMNVTTVLGLAKVIREVVPVFTPEGTPNMNDIPDSELARFAAILNKAEANAEALKAGTMVVEQLLNG